MTRRNASFGDSPPGIAALSAAQDAFPISLTKSSAPVKAAPIDSTIDVKNDFTLSISIIGKPTNINLTASNTIPNAAIGRSQRIDFNTLNIPLINTVGSVIYMNFTALSISPNAIIGKSQKINFSASPINLIRAIGNVIYTNFKYANIALSASFTAPITPLTIPASRPTIIPPIPLIAPNTNLTIPSSACPIPFLILSISRVKRPAITLNAPLKNCTNPSTKSAKPLLIPSPIFLNPSSLKIPPIILPTIFTRPPIRALNTPMIPSRSIPIIPSSLNPFIAPLIPPIRPVIIDMAIAITGTNLANPFPILKAILA